MKYLLVLFILLSPVAGVFAQDRFTVTLDTKNKLSAISYLLQGKSKVICRKGTDVPLGECRFNFDCKKGFFSPYADTLELIGANIAAMVLWYAFSGKAPIVDTLRFATYSYDDTVKSKRDIVMSCNNYRYVLRNTPGASVAQRFNVLRAILPFKTEGGMHNDTLVVILHIIPGYSPVSEIPYYAQLLATVTDDFVLEGRKQWITIYFYDTDTHATYFDFYFDGREREGTGKFIWDLQSIMMWAICLQ